MRFTATLISISHGGNYVEVPAEVAERAGVKHGDRVRGTAGGVAFRSSLMKYSGVFHMGIAKAVLREIGASTGDRIKVSVERDEEPLPGDAVPADLAKALKQSKTAKDGFEAFAPSHRREHVKHILEAKKPETRARRIAQTIEACEVKARTITTARPPRR